MSDVEVYYNRIAEKVGSQRRFKDLNPVEQVQVIQSINLLLQVLNNG